MSVKIKGTTYEMEVDANKNAYVNMPMVSTQGGFAAMASEVDAGTVTGSRYMKELEATDDYRLRVGVDQILFNDNFVGAAVNTTLWSTALNVMTSTVTGGFNSLNAGLKTAAGSYAILRTYRHFPSYKQFTTFAEMDI